MSQRTHLGNKRAWDLSSLDDRTFVEIAVMLNTDLSVEVLSFLLVEE